MSKQNAIKRLVAWLSAPAGHEITRAELDELVAEATASGEASPADAVWFGRQIERQAQRAVEASARASETQRQLEQHMIEVAQVARRLERIATLITELADEARELRRKIDEAIPFGGDGPDERTIQEWQLLATQTETIVARLSKAAGAEGG